MGNEISSQKLEANRHNAKLGGVKTEEGKAASRYNALKHGLLTKEILLKGEDKKELEELGKTLRSELAPANELELLLVDRITANAWRLKRALKTEREMMAAGMTEPDFSLALHGEDEGQTLGKVFVHDLNNNEAYVKFARYEANIERGLFKALHELQRVQGARLGTNVQLPVAIDIDITNQNAVGSFGNSRNIIDA